MTHTKHENCMFFYMAKTYAEIRDAIRDAVYAVAVNGQNTVWNGQTYTKADLEDLMKLDDYYTKKASEEAQTNSGVRYSGRVRYPSGSRRNYDCY